MTNRSHPTLQENPVLYLMELKDFCSTNGLHGLASKLNNVPTSFGMPPSGDYAEILVILQNLDPNEKMQLPDPVLADLQKIETRLREMLLD